MSNDDFDFQIGPGANDDDEQREDATPRFSTQTQREIMEKSQEASQNAGRAPARFPWYVVTLALVLLVATWFFAGVMGGRIVRVQAISATVVVAEATETVVSGTVVAEQNATSTAAVTETQAAEERFATQTQRAIPTDTPTATATATLTPTPTSIGGGGRLIAFLSDQRGGDPDIYILNVDTGEFYPLTDNGVIDGPPDWSPDGERIVFHSNAPGGGRHIYISDPTGENIQQLTFGVDRLDSDPHFSLDGERIVFRSKEGPRTFLRSMDLDGEDEQDLAQLPEIIDYFGLETFGGNNATHIFFSQTTDQRFELLGLPVGGEALDRYAITASGGDVRYVAFSPTGDLAIFTQTAFEPFQREQVYLSNAGCVPLAADNCIIQRVTEDEYNYSFPSFSPDGDLLLVTSDRTGDDELYLMTLTGEIIEQLTDGSPFDEYYGIWQPNGQP